ncbi:MAG: DMT family transporter [Sedimentisphaerales bacterium]|nr:DMT family transporter [Sedimentisphaerales bacterium]
MTDHNKIRKLDFSATSACIGALIFWSIGPVFIKYLTGYLDSWTQNLLRYSVACLVWLPFLVFSIKKGLLDRRIWLRAAVPGVANVIMQSLFACAFYYIGPAFMVLLAKSSLIWVTGFSLVFFTEERALIRSKRFWSGMLLSIMGVIGVMCFREDFTAAGTLKGIVLSLIMAFMWAVYIVSARIAFRDIDSRHGFSVISIYTVVGLLVLGLLYGELGDCVKMGLWQWICVVVSGVTAIALSHTLYYSAMRRIGATIPALVILAQPFIVLAISYVVFRETLNILQLLFGVVLLIGAGVAIWAQEHLRHES